MIIYKFNNIFIGLYRQNINTNRPAYVTGKTFQEVFNKLTN